MTKRRTRIIVVAMVLVALVATMFTVVACNKKGKNANLKNPSDVFALAGVSTGAMLEGMANSGNGVALGGEAVTDEVVEELNKYMAVVDSIIAGDPESNKVENSTREGYEKVQIMRVPNMSGEPVEYKLYYNEIPKTAEEEEADEEGEEEFESHIKGVMVVGDNEFPITGDIEVEKEADEVEQSIEFVAYLNEAKTDYIKFAQETETETEDGVTENETEYSYKIYKNDKFESSFKLEIENEGKEDEYSIKTKDAEGNKTVFKLEREKKGDKTNVIVKYTKNGEKGEFKVEATEDANGNPIYKYIMKDKEIEKDRD